MIAKCKILFVLLATLGTLAVAQSGGGGGADIASLQQTAQSNPKNADAWIDLGQAYLQAKTYDKAKDAFLQAISLNYMSADAHFGLGLATYAQGDYPSALFEFSEVARLFPDRFDGHFNEAVTLAKLRKPSDAVKAFQAAVSAAKAEAKAGGQQVSDPDLVNAYLGMAGQLESLKKYQDAADAYAEALKIKQDPTTVYLHAHALYQAGHGLDALPELTKLEASSNDYQVSLLIADIYVQANQDDYALRALQRAEAKAVKAGDKVAEANLLVKLGLLQKTMGRDADATASFQQAVVANPQSWQAQYNLGVSRLEAGGAQSALTSLQKAAALTDGGDVELALATAYDQLNQPQAALAAAQRASESLSDAKLVAQAEFIVARSRYHLQDYQGADAAMSKVIAQEPDDAQAQLWAGLVKYQLKEYSAAAQAYERAAQLDPKSMDAKVNLGAAYLAAQRYQDAEVVYQTLVQQDPNDAEAFYNLGWALFSQNRRDEAKQAWQQALKLGYQGAQKPLQEYF